MSQVIILAICPGFQIGMFSVLCLFLLIICFHCSWLCFSRLAVWIYHLIILTSLSLLFGHFKITCISQLQTYTVEGNFYIWLPLSLNSFASCAPWSYSLLLWVEDCFLTTSSRSLLSYSLRIWSHIFLQSGYVIFFTSHLYWKQGVWPVAEWIWKENKVINEWMDTCHDASRHVFTREHLRLNRRRISQTNEPPSISAGKNELIWPSLLHSKRKSHNSHRNPKLVWQPYTWDYFGFTWLWKWEDKSQGQQQKKQKRTSRKRRITLPCWGTLFGIQYCFNHSS